MGCGEADPSGDLEGSGQLDGDVAAAAQLIHQSRARFCAVFLFEPLHHGLIGIGVGDQVEGEVDQFSFFGAEPHIHKRLCHGSPTIKPHRAWAWVRAPWVCGGSGRPQTAARHQGR
ncbi:Hypothetical protein SynRCC307_1774 [Synechococcus sp. RCC307]|nr:Hypothetical protein SynRCC307_1774 [Synechococcus sp. RCC307]